MVIQKMYWANTTLISITGTINAVWSIKTTKDVSSVRWFNDQEELLEGEDFKLQTSEEKDHLEHSVIFNEVYPDDQGTYRVIIQNKNAETKESSAVLTGTRFYRYQNQLKYQPSRISQDIFHFRRLNMKGMDAGSSISVMFLLYPPQMEPSKR